MPQAYSTRIICLEGGRMTFEPFDIEEAIRKVREYAEKRLAENKSADEFVQIGEADGFKLYLVAGKTMRSETTGTFHENPRDVFMLLLEGSMEFAFENGGKKTVKKGQYFVLPKHVGHSCIFRKITIALEGVYEKGS
jgi:quercetin dioxygenase-like cupin family protein